MQLKCERASKSTVYRSPSMMSQGKTPGKDPRERPLGKAPGKDVAFTAYVGSFQVKIAREDPWDIIDGVYCTIKPVD